MRLSVWGIFSPAQILILSVVGIIPVSMFVLSLPICTTVRLSMIDLFFTATSLVTVTGLSIVPFSSFTPVGHFVILLLMQIGGLGIITLTLFLISFFVDFGIGAQFFSARLFAFESWKNIQNIIVYIITFCLVIECIGAFLVFFCLDNSYPPLYRIFLSFFHVISAFSSAGISLLPLQTPLFQNNYFLLLLLWLIMIIGEVGFIVWHEFTDYLLSLKNHTRFHFSLHAKIVFYSTVGLIIGSFLIYWMLERHNTLNHLSNSMSLINSLFNGTAGRGIGLSTVAISNLQLATLLLIMVLTFVGASPGSTGSGVKTMSITVLITTIKAAIAGRTVTVIRGRTIPRQQVYQALAIVALSIAWIFVMLFLLLITEQASFIEVLFELVSAFGNCGLSTGITPLLSCCGKLFIALTMIVGRVSCLAALLALIRTAPKIEYSYPEERVMLG